MSERDVVQSESGGRVLDAVQLLLRELNQTQLEAVRDSVHSLLKH